MTRRGGPAFGGMRRGALGALAFATLLVLGVAWVTSESGTEREPCAGCLADAQRGAGDASSWSDFSQLHAPGFGTIRFVARDGNRLEALIYRPHDFDAANGPIWFVMHGASRAVERYIRTAAPVAERHGALAIAVHFPKRLYPTQTSYTLGVTSGGPVDRDAWGAGRWRAPQDFLYAELEYLFDAVRQTLDGRQAGYYLFGHSAGAQFVHRLLTFLPAPRVVAAVAANAGWYTLPLAGDDPHRAMPYGLGGTPLQPEDLRAFFETPFAVLVGERDVATPDADDLLRGTDEAMAQGETRRARGAFYFEAGRGQAEALEAEFAWRLAEVPRAAHDAAAVIQSAGWFLFDRTRESCREDDAAGGRMLRITEILADPPDGDAGDANRDGERDPIEDEFVEIVNAGPTPVCLSGWALGDADDPERHVFPLGPALAPGGTVVVFGGGVPRGDFGGDVQTAAFGGRLSLTNEGDVVTLRDARDTVALQISWGDCGGAACAPSHWEGDLGIESSIVSDAHTTWTAHPHAGGRPYSPGAAPAAALRRGSR